MHHWRKGNRLLDGETRIKRRVAVLKNHCDLAAIRFCAERVRSDEIAVKDHIAGGWCNESHQQARCRRFTAAGFAHDSQRLPLHEIEIEIVHRFDDLLPTEEATTKRKVLGETARA